MEKCWLNYQFIYSSLIERARNRVLSSYKESHHIIPKCMGGSNDPDNLVDLTPEEHYLAHQLLVKLNPGHVGLSFAATTMAQSSKYLKRNGNKLYGWLRREHAKNITATQTGKVYFNNGVKSIKLFPWEDVPEGFVKGRHYSPTKSTKHSRNNGHFKNKKIQDELRERRWTKDRQEMCKNFGVDTIEQARELVLEYKKELHPRYWVKPMLERYPFMSKLRLNTLIK